MCFYGLGWGVGGSGVALFCAAVHQDVEVDKNSYSKSCISKDSNGNL